LLRNSATNHCRIGSLLGFLIEANARQQLLEHLGFHADTIEKAATEFNIVKGVETMSVDEKSKAPMVSVEARVINVKVAIYQD